MLKLRCGDFEIEFSDQTNHTFGSADNLRRYERESYVGTDGYIVSQHAVVVKQDGEEIASHILAAGGGGTGIGERSALTHENQVILAIGDHLCALEVPSLDVIWRTQVDDATCFGVHLPPRRDCLISHGELSISRLDFGGNMVWQSYGADIFTGELQTFENHIEVVDWNGWRYSFDSESGTSVLLKK